VRLRHDDGREVAEAALGDGPVDAVLRAMERATDTALQLTRFQVQAVGEGGDAQGEARLAAQHDGRAWNGHGVSTDIVEAAAQAALAIVNRIAQSTPTAAPSPRTTKSKALGAHA
jgi:2-isopropylmalate synthase